LSVGGAARLRPAHGEGVASLRGLRAAHGSGPASDRVVERPDLRLRVLLVQRLYSGPGQCTHAFASTAKFQASRRAGTCSVRTGSSVACLRELETCHRSGQGVAQIHTTTPSVLSAWWMWPAVSSIAQVAASECSKPGGDDAATLPQYRTGVRRP